MNMSPRALLDHVPLLCMLFWAAASDVRHRRIPNWLTFGLILSGVARAAVFGGFSSALGGLFAGASVPFVLYVLGALGGGDVKLLAGIGAWLGPTQALAVLVVQCVIGLAVAMIQAMGQGRTMALLRNSAVLAADMAQNGLGSPAGKSFSSIDRPLPYAVPVALATLVVVAWPL
jgi:prepilin peptidase CpaA